MSLADIFAAIVVGALLIALGASVTFFLYAMWRIMLWGDRE